MKEIKKAPFAGLPVAPKHFLLLHGTLFLYSAVSIFAKQAGMSMVLLENERTFLWLGLEFLTLFLYAVLWQKTLRHLPLNYAYSNKAICTLWICLAGIVFFGEALTWGKATGILVVLAGVYLVVTDHE